jgi:hypothetical protein
MRDVSISWNSREQLVKSSVPICGLIVGTVYVRLGGIVSTLLHKLPIINEANIEPALLKWWGRCDNPNSRKVATHEATQAKGARATSHKEGAPRFHSGRYGYLNLNG